MNGVAAIRVGLVADAALIAIVPADRIAAGVLPTGTALPALSIMQVSSTDLNIPAPGAKRHVVDRVQVTALATTYVELRATLAAAKAACADSFPTVAGISEVSILTDGAGPDFMDDEAKFYLGSQDFVVAYNQNT